MSRRWRDKKQLKLDVSTECPGEFNLIVLQSVNVRNVIELRSAFFNRPIITRLFVNKKRTWLSFAEETRVLGDLSVIAKFLHVLKYHMNDRYTSVIIDSLIWSYTLPSKCIYCLCKICGCVKLNRADWLKLIS